MEMRWITLLNTKIFERIKSQDFPVECRGMYYFAKGRHAHQNRKVSGYPYFVHCKGVAFIIAENGGTIDQINAALAHDLLEDTETSFNEIRIVSNSMHCAELCSELRNNKYEIDELGKEEYMTDKLINLSDDALLIKIADMYYNLSDNPTDTAKKRMLVNLHALWDFYSKNNKVFADVTAELITTIFATFDD